LTSTQRLLAIKVANTRKHSEALNGYVIVVEDLMPRFYFHLVSKDSHTSDDNGKELATLNDAYEHARKLIDKILFHVGSDDAKAWKVVISNDQNDARIIVPFPISCSFPAQREAAARKYGKQFRQADENQYVVREPAD
jgi:hypothetical protein